MLINSIIKIPLILSCLLFLGYSSPTPPINVILISVDTLRPDHLHCYGYSRNTSPNIDRLANRGTLFKRTVSTTTWTLPAHMALFTSLYDSVHGVKTGNTRLDLERTTLSEVFKEHGYATAAFVSGPYLNRHFGFNQGFDQYQDLTDAQIPAELMFQEDALSGETLKDFIEGKQKANRAAHRSITSPIVTEAVLKWFETMEQPFFLFVHYFDVHYDFIPPGKYATLFDPEYDGEISGENFIRNPMVQPGMPQEDLNHILALYDGEIAFTDYHIGLLLDDIEERGLSNNTLIVLTSDHGEEFFEHGVKGHQLNLYEQTLRIPLLFSLPGRVQQGREIANLVRIIDVGPTILELADLSVPPEMMGRSLTPFLFGRMRGPAPPAFCELKTARKDLYGLRGEGWKVLYNKKNRRWEFYRFGAKHGEARSSRLPVPDRFREKLLDDLRTYKQMGNTLPRKDHQRSADLPPGLRRKLKDLGYIN